MTFIPTQKNGIFCLEWFLMQSNSYGLDSIQQTKNKKTKTKDKEFNNFSSFCQFFEYSFLNIKGQSEHTVLLF